MQSIVLGAEPHATLAVGASAGNVRRRTGAGQGDGLDARLAQWRQAATRSQPGFRARWSVPFAGVGPHQFARPYRPCPCKLRAINTQADFRPAFRSVVLANPALA